MNKKPSTKQLYYDVYKHLRDGEIQSKIVKFTGYDKGYISRIAKRLVESGYLVKYNDPGRETFYSPTKKIFSPDKFRQLTKLNPVRHEILRHRRNILRIQKCTFRSKIVDDSKSCIKWDSGPNYINGVSFYDYCYPFENLGVVRFRRFVGKDEDSLLIIMPSVSWAYGDDDNPDLVNDQIHCFIKEQAGICHHWFMKRFKFNLSCLEVCQKPHICSPAPGHLAEAGIRGSYNVNGVMLDSSAPDNIPEVESEDAGDVITLLNAPMRIKELEIRVGNMEKVLVRIESGINRIESMFSPPNNVNNNEGMFR